MTEDINHRNEYRTDRLRKAAQIMWLATSARTVSARIPDELDAPEDWLQREMRDLAIVLDLGPRALPTALDRLRYRCLQIQNAVRIEASASKDRPKDYTNSVSTRFE